VRRYGETPRKGNVGAHTARCRVAGGIGEAGQVTGDPLEGAGRAGSTPRLDLDDRARLLDAIQALPTLRARHVRDEVVEELARELGPMFLPNRDDDPDVDSRNIMLECIRHNSVHTLVKVLRVVLPPSREFRQLVDVVENAVPMQALTPGERSIIHEALADLPPDALREVLVIEELELADTSAIDTPDAAVAALETRIGKQAGAELALALFLEMAARQVDQINRRRVNQIVDTLGRRWGTEADVQAITRSAIEGYSRPLEADPQATATAETRPSGAILDPADHKDSGDEVVKTIAPSPTPEMIASAPEIMGGIPPQNPNFVGRGAIMEKLEGTLAKHGQATVLPTALHGLGGVGKSQLAAEYARRYQAKYQLIWWIPSNEERSIRRSLLSLARRLRIEESQDAQITVDTVLDTLRLGRPFADWLLIFDDAQDPAVVRQYMPSGPGQVLISSRNSSWRSSATALELDVFSPEESRDFLARRWPDLDDAQANDLGGRLGYLPLALEQAAAVHNETGMPLDKYLSELDGRPARILGEGESTEYPVSVAKTWQLAFQKLSERSPAAAQLLEICAFLSSNPISVPMLARGRGANLPSPLAEAMRDEMKMRGAVRDIGRYALAQLDPSRDFISIHMLVRAVLRDSMEDDERRRATERSAHELLALANPGQPENRATRQQLAQIAPHVKSSGVLYSDDPHVRRVVLDVARYYYVTGDYYESESLATEAVDNWRSRLGADDEMTLVACFHLGNARRALGDYSGAREINEDTLERMTRTLGEDHEYTLRIANSSGADLRLLGEFEEAETRDETSLERCKTTLGDDDPLTLRVANNLAVDSRLLGKYRAALELDEDTYQRRQVVLGDNHPEVLASAVNLGRDRAGVGDYREALALARNTQSRYQALADHAYMLLARRNLAVMLRFTGNYEESLAEATAIYDRIRREYGPRHEHAMSAALTLFNTLRVCGQIAEAQRIAEETLDSYTAQLGASHPFTLSCATNVAVVYRAIDRPEDAYELDRAANESLLRALGPDHSYTLISSNNMSNNLALRGESAEALAQSEQTYLRSVKIRGHDHPYSLACAANYALDLEAVGRLEDASRLRAETVERMRRKLGPEHPETVNVERGRRAESVIEVPPA
jgi:Tetratricopeptide repeat/Effector-associated domain 2/NB-ARC domain